MFTQQSRGWLRMWAWGPLGWMIQFSICFGELRVAEREAGKYSEMWLTSAGAQRRELLIHGESWHYKENFMYRPGLWGGGGIHLHRRRWRLPGTIPVGREEKSMRKEENRQWPERPQEVLGLCVGYPWWGPPKEGMGLGRKRKQWKEGVRVLTSGWGFYSVGTWEQSKEREIKNCLANITQWQSRERSGDQAAMPTPQGRQTDNQRFRTDVSWTLGTHEGPHG